LTGTLRGTLSVNGRHTGGIEVALVDVNTGAFYRAQSGPGGSFELRLPSGDYITAIRGGSLVLSRAPSRVSVKAGRESALRLELVRLSALTLREAISPAGSTAASLAAIGIPPQIEPARGPKRCDGPVPHGTCADGN